MVAPISGEHFVVQMCGLRYITQTSYKPQTAFTGSGGTIIIYAACAADWNPSRLDEVASNLSSNLFIKTKQEPFVQFIPSIISDIFSGAMYESSEKSTFFFKSYFNEANVSDVEIWVGAINQQTGKIGLFCNLDVNESIIKGDNYDVASFNSEPLQYFSKNIDNITKSCKASASIPMFIEPVKIESNYYIDCGTKYASAFTPLKHELKKHLQDKNQLHILYVSGYDVEESIKIVPDKPNSFELLQTVPSHVVRGHVQQDRSTAHDMLYYFGSKIYHAKAKIECLKIILKRIKNVKDNVRWASVVELYPIKAKTVDLTEFTGEDVLKCMDTIKLGIRIRWVGCKDVFRNICGLYYIKYL